MSSMRLQNLSTRDILSSISAGYADKETYDEIYRNIGEIKQIMYQDLTGLIGMKKYKLTNNCI